MTYRVFWSPRAEQRLEEIAFAAADPKAVAAAARIIDERLVHDPRSFGESREENTRIAFYKMLGVEFEMLDDVQTVIVFDVWRIRRH
jgi:plasmid stabilization system protein ParE